MTVHKGDTIRFTGHDNGCTTNISPKLGAIGKVNAVYEGDLVIVDWANGETAVHGGPAGRMLFRGEYIVTLKAPQELPEIAADIAPHESYGETPHPTWMQYLLNPNRWYWSLVWAAAGATFATVAQNL